MKIYFSSFHDYWVDIVYINPISCLRLVEIKYDKDWNSYLCNIFKTKKKFLITAHKSLN